MSAQSLLVKLCLSDSFEHLVHACTICSHHESIALKCMMPEPQGEHAFAAFNSSWHILHSILADAYVPTMQQLHYKCKPAGIMAGLCGRLHN